MTIGEILKYAANEEAMFESVMANSGYQRKTTFFSDLSIAECYGAKGIRETYKNVKQSWCKDVVFWTEFVMCLNHKCWEHHEKKNDALSKLYCVLYEKANNYALCHFKGDDLSYYYSTTD